MRRLRPARWVLGTAQDTTHQTGHGPQTTTITAAIVTTRSSVIIVCLTLVADLPHPALSYCVWPVVQMIFPSGPAAPRAASSPSTRQTVIVLDLLDRDKMSEICRAGFLRRG